MGRCLVEGGGGVEARAGARGGVRKTHVNFAAESPGTVELVFREHPDGTVWKG
jgi:hypothetical protein